MSSPKEKRGLRFPIPRSNSSAAAIAIVFLLMAWCLWCVTLVSNVEEGINVSVVIMFNRTSEMKSRIESTPSVLVSQAYP
jgi:hypothetical protein